MRNRIQQFQPLPPPPPYTAPVSHQSSSSYSTSTEAELPSATQEELAVRRSSAPSTSKVR
jgi:hypothetical protein